MEFFHGVNVDWMGKAKYFVSLSLVLLAVGWAIVSEEAGLSTESTSAAARWFMSASPARRRSIRFARASQTPACRIAPFSRSATSRNPSSQNDVVIGLEQSGRTMSRSTRANRRFSTFSTKLSARQAQPASRISIPSPPRRWPPTSRRKIRSLWAPTPAIATTQLAQQLTDARDKDHGGIVTNFDELKSVAGATPAVLNALSSGFSLGNSPIRNVEIVGPKVGAQLRRQAILATLYALRGHVGIYCDSL